MSCGERVDSYWNVKAEPVPTEMSKCTVIRWLISEKDGAKNFFMRMFDMEPNCSIKAHYHPWEHEIFILEGEGKVRIGSRTYNVGPGTFLYIPPNVEHEYWSFNNGLRFLCMIPARPTVEEKGEPLEC